MRLSGVVVMIYFLNEPIIKRIGNHTGNVITDHLTMKKMRKRYAGSIV